MNMKMNLRAFSRLVLLAGAALLPAAPAVAQDPGLPCPDPPHWLILLDCSGSMGALRTSPATGNTRWVDSVAQAVTDISLQNTVDPTTLFSVWTFSNTSAAQVSSFDLFGPTLFTLFGLSSHVPSGSTPLVDSMCDAIDAVELAHGPGGTNRCRVLLVYSDGGDNSSSGSCFGSGTSTGPGTTCGTFDLGSWQENICTKLSGSVTGLFRYWNSFQFVAPPISTTLCAWSQASGGAYVFVADTDPNYPGTGDCITDWIQSGGASGSCDCPSVAVDNSGQLGCDGSGGNCPCATSGAPGHGCVNTNPNLLGAKLVGTGNAVIPPDTFVLTVTDGPANKPGLFIQGSNAISNPVGDGLLCTSPQLRYTVQILDPFGGTSRTGFGVNANPADTKHYQFWYRDQTNPCTGSFNFTNSWFVTW